jgi:2-polyprenyl-3-methyl-5-hydroxy-6-metoxy-1,4-benzoquinol methylase
MKLENDFEYVNCDYCGSENFRTILTSVDYYNNIPGEFQIVKCTNCNLIYTNPRPKKKIIDKFYPDTARYLQPQTPNFSGIFEKIKRIVLEIYYGYSNKTNLLLKIIYFPALIFSYNWIKSQCIPKYIKNGKLLDIGSSYGLFLYEMKNFGWHVKGIETNQGAVDYGIDKLGLDIVKSSIDDFEAAEKYDVVTLRMVLEHVFHPMDTLRKVKDFIKKDGTLIFSVPNINGFDARMFKSHWYSLHLPAHLTHFTKKSITKYLQSLNYKNIKFYYQNNDRDFYTSLKYLKNEKKSFVWIYKLLSMKPIRKLIIRPAIRIISLFNGTCRITVYANT